MLVFASRGVPYLVLTIYYPPLKTNRRMNSISSHKPFHKNTKKQKMVGNMSAINCKYIKNGRPTSLNSCSCPYAGTFIQNKHTRMHPTNKHESYTKTTPKASANRKNIYNICERKIQKRILNNLANSASKDRR